VNVDTAGLLAAGFPETGLLLILLAPARDQWTFFSCGHRFNTGIAASNQDSVETPNLTNFVTK
jgi:hypothetical protein